MRIALSVLCLVAIIGVGRAQPYWAQDVGGIGNDHVADVKVDADGSIYMTGEFGGTMVVGGQIYGSAGSIDLFVARLDGAGNVVWFWTGGGAGIDRGLKVSIGTGSMLALTGEFLGTATLQGHALTSVGGTADMLVAVLSKADGSLQWIQQGGGPAGTDRPYGVSLAADGRVSVAGEFRGTATWGASSLTSAIDPSTGQPNSDVFVATYSAVGDLQWLKQGRAKYADRAIDLVHDAAGDLYVTGQFSDTITFDVEHPNVILNASFLVKFDQAGNEVWFRHMGGAGFNHVRDIVLAPSGHLVLVGDVQGNMLWFGPPQATVPSGEPYAYYLLDVTTAGQLTDQVTVGSTSGVSAAALDVRDGTIAVLGQFNCRFTDLSALYGQGVFMAVGEEDLFVTKHAAASLDLQEGQQFGGRSAKTAGQIALLPGGDPVFCGSYEENLIFPAAIGFTADATTWGGSVEGNGVTSYCTDASYGAYAVNVADVLNDGFIARGYIAGRLPYDWWMRSGSGCDRSTREPCIRDGNLEACPDTISACGAVVLTVDMKYSYNSAPTANILGPDVDFLWSNGSTSSAIAASATGDYWVRITARNGCWSWQDTVHVIILPWPPAPLISSDLGHNATSAVGLVELCDPESHWSWAANPNPNYELYWTTPSGEQVHADSVLVDTTGTYTLYTESPNGCIRQNGFNVIDRPHVPLPDLQALLRINYPTDLDHNDTLPMCGDGGILFQYVPTWIVNGVEGDLPDGLQVLWGLHDPPTTVVDDGPQNSQLTQQGTGWYVHELSVMVTNRPCGEDTVLFHATDSIYVQLFPPLGTQVTLTGPNVLCDGDTALLVATCIQCDSMHWNGTGLIELSQDSMLVSGAGSWSVNASAVDTNGCTTLSSASINITVPTGPTLDVAPVEGIICPDQTATLSTTLPGTGHVWYGPEGPITGQGGTLVTDVPGDYYLIMEVADGCEVTSNSVTLANYGTPYLNVTPHPALCSLDDEVVLNVMTSVGSGVEWAPPLSGSALSQTIHAPGIYACTVTACNITTPLSIEVILDPATATVTTPGPYILCNGDSVQLHGDAGADEAFWLPGNTSGVDLWVDATGIYRLVVRNASGCADTSATVQVTAIGFPDPVTATGDTVCADDVVHLVATGSGDLNWYTDAAATTLLHAGGAFDYTANGSTVLYVTQEEAGCRGAVVPIPIGVIARPAPLQMTGPDAVCEGAPFQLQCHVPDSVQLVWTTPSGTYTTSVIAFPAAALDDSGVYTCTPSWNGCTGGTASRVVAVAVPQPIDLPSPRQLCTGGIVVFTLPDGFTAPHWSTGSTANSITVSAAATILVEALDPSGCGSMKELIIYEEDCGVVIPNIFSPNGDGRNDRWRPEGGFVAARALIYNRWGNLVHEGDVVERGWDGKHDRTGEPCSEGVYYYVLNTRTFNDTFTSHSGYIQLVR